MLQLNDTLSYQLGEVLSPLFWGAGIGAAVWAVRKARRKRRAAAAGEEPRRVSPWPSIGISVLVLYGLMAVAAAAQHSASHSTAHPAVLTEMNAVGAFQQTITTAFHKPPTSPADLNARLAAIHRIQPQGTKLQLALRGVDRSGYGPDETALMDGLQAMVGADVAYVNDWQQMITRNRVRFDASGATLDPNDLSRIAGEYIAIRQAALVQLEPSVALKTISQAEADSDRATIEAQIATTRQTCSC
jgi:hypothetical protein